MFEDILRELWRMHGFALSCELDIGSLSGMFIYYDLH
jgi:hypothetical protein